MPKPSQAGMIDPLATFLERRRGDQRPVPLVATSIEVEIASGIASVATRRVFRNVEVQSIEAVLTFPIPVHATLFGLEAQIGERTLVARVERRDQARETYQEALVEGFTAVLHEEVLRGVHMLSVAPLAPGAEIAVTARWVSTLAFVGGDAQLRIPMTVGEVYGLSPLADTDDLTTGGEPAMADLVVRSDAAVTLLSGTLVDGRGRVPTDAPIDLAVAQTDARAITGLTAEGKQIEVTVSAQPTSGDGLDLAILIDRSGSMDLPASDAGGPATKHQEAVAALARLAPMLTDADHLDLWQFDSSVEHVGAARRVETETTGAALRDQFRALLGRLGEPRGGTEIGAGLSQVIEKTSGRDLLLITDGLSHALDVQELARQGKRISVLLVGEDSLEANVGHLAALSGGDLIVAMGGDIGAALDAVLVGLKAPFRATIAGERGLRAIRRGGEIAVVEAGGPAEARGPMARAVGALAASLRLSTLPADQAAVLAEQEGLVTHLTSLVLVDRAGEAVDGFAATRKVALPSPRIARLSQSVMVSPTGTSPATPARIAAIEARALRTLRGPTQARRLRSFLDVSIGSTSPTGRSTWVSRSERGGPERPHDDLEALAARIKWNEVAERLVVADLSELPGDVMKAVPSFAAEADVVAAAERLGLDPLLMTIGWLARLAGDAYRAAPRVAWFIFRGIEPAIVDRELSYLDLARRPVRADAGRPR